MISLRTFNKKIFVFCASFQPQADREKEGRGEGGGEWLCWIDHPVHLPQSHSRPQAWPPRQEGREESEGINNEMRGLAQTLWSLKNPNEILQKTKWDQKVTESSWDAIKYAISRIENVASKKIRKNK